jgi:hypothetical protein
MMPWCFFVLPLGLKLPVSLLSTLSIILIDFSYLTKMLIFKKVLRSRACAMRQAPTCANRNETKSIERG